MLEWTTGDGFFDGDSKGVPAGSPRLGARHGGYSGDNRNRFGESCRRRIRVGGSSVNRFGYRAIDSG